MTEALEKLYDLVAGTIQMDEEQEKKLEALSVAKKGVLEALETPGARPCLELWDVGWPGGGAAGEGHSSGGVGSRVGAGPPTAQGDGLSPHLLGAVR